MVGGGSSAVIISNSLFIPQAPREKPMGASKKQDGYNEGMGPIANNHARLRKRADATMAIARIVGFALLLAWFSASGFSASSASASHADLLTLAAFTTLLFAIAFRRRARDSKQHARMFYLLFSAMAAAGTIAPSFIDNNLVVSIICPLLAAAGLAILVLGWGSLFSKQNMTEVILETIMAQLLMSIVHLTSCFLSPLLEAVFRGVYLIGSALMLAVAKKGAVSSKHSSVADEGCKSSRLTAERQPFIRFILAINLWGAAINLLYNIYRYCAPLDFTNLSAPAALIEITFLGILFFVANMRRMKDTQLYTIIFAAILLAFLLVPILGIQSAVPFYALFLGFAALSVLTWTLSAQICHTYRLDPNMVYGCAIGSFLGLQIVAARVIAQDAFSGITSSPIELNTLCLIGAFISFAAYQLVFSRHSAIWPEIKEATQEAPAEQLAGGDAPPGAETVADPFDQWDNFAALYHLTPRESEVLLLFARGRSYERIQETLTIARGTVNYHMSNAYRKIGISSRQDLLDRLDETAHLNDKN